MVRLCSRKSFADLKLVLRLKIREYATVPLAALVGKIATDRSEQALWELHNQRTIFTTADEAGLLFVELLRRLADDAARDAWAQNEIDAAVSLTTDKFTRLARTRGGLDCGKTFGAVAAEVQQLPPMDSLTMEVQVAGMLNMCVRRHFRWALREARRSGNRTRFLWRVAGGELRLLMPETISGKARTKWLKDHVPDADPTRVGERERVQAIIDSQLGANLVPIDLIQVADPAFEAPWRALDRVTEDGLARCVADEKACNVDDLRPAIRRLGADGIRHLVLMIFESVGDDGITSARIAATFGLDTATFSRFAGKITPNRAVPDLWRNLARLLAANARFREVCVESGVLDVVQKIVSPAGSS